MDKYIETFLVSLWMAAEAQGQLLPQLCHR